jgi:hypothetical protein
MALPRMTDAFPSVPLVLLAILEAWLLADLLAMGDPPRVVSAIVLWLAGLALFALSTAFHWRWARQLGLVALGGTYVGIHAAVLGVQLAPALVFVAVLIAQVELRILAERFTPLFLPSIPFAERKRMGDSLVRAVLRVSIACVLSIVVPLLVAEVASTGLVPLTSIATAFLLSAALIAVVVLLALLPALGGRARKSGPFSEGAKDI